MSLPFQTFREFAEEHGLQDWVVRYCHRKGLLGVTLPVIGCRQVIPRSFAKRILRALKEHQFIRTPEQQAARKRNGFASRTSKAMATASAN